LADQSKAPVPRWQTDGAGALVAGFGVYALAALTWPDTLVTPSDPPHVSAGLVLLVLPSLGIASGMISRRFTSLAWSYVASIIGWSVAYVVNFGSSPIWPKLVLGSGANVFNAAFWLLPVIAAGHAVGVWASSRPAESLGSTNRLGIYLAGRAIGLPIQRASTAFVQVEGAPAMIAGDIRGSLVFGGLLLYFLLVIVAGPLEKDGHLLPHAYPILGLLCLLEVRIATGLAWYVLTWRRIPIAIRAVIALVIGFLALDFAVLGVEYLLGTPLLP
jgi:hypothetical protein